MPVADFFDMIDAFTDNAASPATVPLTGAELDDLIARYGG